MKNKIIKPLLFIAWAIFVLFMFFVAPFVAYELFKWPGVYVWMVLFIALNILPFFGDSETDFGGGYY